MIIITVCISLAVGILIGKYIYQNKKKFPELNITPSNDTPPVIDFSKKTRDFLNEINEQTDQAYELYQLYLNKIKYPFDFSEEEFMEQAPGDVEYMKKVYIGNAFKEILYLSDEDIAKYSSKLDRLQFLFFNGLLVEKKLEIMFRKGNANKLN